MSRLDSRHLARCNTTVLHGGSLVTVSDAWCREPRSGLQRERYASGHTLHFTRRGAYVTHQGAGARDTVVAEPGHVLLFNHDAPYRVSHPLDGGDAGTVLEFDVKVAREVMGRHDRAAGRDDAAPFQVSHVLASPELVLSLHRLRGTLLDTSASAVAAEEQALGILDTVARAAASASGARAPRARRASTRRARRELAEAVRLRLAADPAADVSLATLARELAASPYHLARAFRAEAGIPIHQYLLRLRLTLALERLADPETSLGALALDLGFASHAHFTTTFRRAFAVAPSRVRGMAGRDRELILNHHGGSAGHRVHEGALRS